MSDSCESVSDFPKRVRFYRNRVKKLKPSRKSRKHKRRRSKRSKRKLWRPTSRRKSCYDKDEFFEEDECFDCDSVCSSDSGGYFGSDFDFELVEEPISTNSTKISTKKMVDQKYSQIHFDKKLPLIYKGIQFKK